MFKRLKEFLKKKRKESQNNQAAYWMMRSTKSSITTGMRKAARMKTTFMEIMVGTVPARIGIHAAGKMAVEVARITATAA